MCFQTCLMIRGMNEGAYELGVELARKILSTLGMTADERSEQFQLLSPEMLKLRVTLREVATTLKRPGKIT